MATVFLAADMRHGRKVALKVLKPELAAVVGAERFLAEIKTTANLQHLFSETLLVSALAIALAGSAYLALARVLLGRGGLAGRVVGTLCSAYTNAGNLGLPIAAYVLAGSHGAFS